MYLPSGDQNGATPASVPASGWEVNESSERNQSCILPAASTALKTRWRPSGDKASVGALLSVVFDPLGREIARRVTCAADDGSRRDFTEKGNAANSPSTATAAVIHAS